MTENSVFFKLDKFQIMLRSGVEPHPSGPQIPLFCSHAVPCRFIMPRYNHPQDTTKRFMEERLLWVSSMHAVPKGVLG